MLGTQGAAEFVRRAHGTPIQSDSSQLIGTTCSGRTDSALPWEIPSLPTLTTSFSYTQLRACGGGASSLFPTRMDHHVYFWLKEDFKTPADRAVFEQGLDSLFEIDLVKSGRWAVPAVLAPRPVLDQSWDYALTIQFDSIENHDAYQVAPNHQAFLNTFRDWWAQVQVKDLA